MYSKGREGLRNLDKVLASLRQGALKESRATREEVARCMIREDVHRQNEERRRRQQQQGGGQEVPSPSPSSSLVRVRGPPMASGVPSGSRLVGCGENDKGSGMSGAEGLPVWYDGCYTATPCTAERARNGHAPTADRDEKESGGSGDTNLCAEESAMVVDVTQRVSQAERTLYPTLVANVAACATADEGNHGGDAFDVGGSEVIEWDDRGAPVRLRSTWLPVGPQTLVPVSGAGDKTRDSARGAVMFSGRTSATTTQTIGFDKNLCAQLYEYTRKEDPLPSVLTAVCPAEEGPPLPVGSRGTSDQRAGNRMRHGASGGLCDRGSGTRRRNRPPLSTEGTAVAESSASAIAGRIRRAVEKRHTASVDSTQKNMGSGSCSSSRVGHSSGGRCSVAYEPDEVVCVVTHVVNPLTAFFCTSCGACSARDVVTGDPHTCTACGEPFEALPPPPPRRGACLMDTVVTESKNSALVREEGLAAGPPAPVKKCTVTTSTMTTTTTPTTTSTATTDTSTMPTAARAIASTQAGAVRNMPSLAATAVQGVYFLHLWDQATAVSHK